MHPSNSVQPQHTESLATAAPRGAAHSVSATFRSTVVVGAGAVGSFFGALLARAGHRVTLIARAAHVQAIQDRGLQLHMGGQVHTVPMTATTELGAVADADLVLFCVKSTNTDTVARQMAPLLPAHALVLSLQNGVDNAETLARHLPHNVVVPAVVYVATAMPEAGVVKHFGRGDLVIGPLHGASLANTALQQQLHAVADLFASAQVPVRIAPDVMAALWMKLVVNCAYNAISGLSQQPYGPMAALPAIHTLMQAVVQEVVAVAQAAGQPLQMDAALAAMDHIAVAMPGQLSSTAQDMARSKPSEIDHLNGFIARRGAELGVATPVNQTLHALVKLVEAGRSGTAAATL